MNHNITPERKKELLKFCKRTNLKFKNLDLLNQAFYHRSSSNEGTKEPDGSIYNNERLEFLGDSVLGMVTASYLFNKLDKSQEGELAKIKSAVVSEKALYPWALEFGIDKLLVLGHGEELTGGRQKPAILADCMEAIIGACYLEIGYKACEVYVLSFIIPSIENVMQNGTTDYKSQLQEYCQKLYKECPVYEMAGTEGPEHKKIFKMFVSFGGKKIGPVEGNSKKDAEQNAAKMALEREREIERKIERKHK